MDKNRIIKSGNYPFNEKELRTKAHLVHKVGDYVGFICPNCNNVMMARITIRHNIQPTIIDKEFDYDLDMVTSFQYKCHVCQFQVVTTEYYTPNIVDIVAVLNAKGYKVTKADEGHDTCDCIAIKPFINFADNSIINCASEITGIPLPDGWMLNDMRVIASLVYEGDMDKVPVHKRMEALRHWVNSIPPAK